MQSTNAISLTTNVLDWLANTRSPRILHVFEQACNLINERGEVLSIVISEIGNGPFNLVVDGTVSFAGNLSPESQISIFPNKLMLADLTINTKEAILWNSYPDWEKLHAERYDVFDQLMSLSLPNYQPPIPESIAFNLSRALAKDDISTARIAACQLAGLGQGLTPSGDDYLMGAIYAAFIIHPIDVATSIASEIAETAAPLTTSLSAAWLKSAGIGQTGSYWHDFFDALLSENVVTIQAALEKLHHVGQTSGDDALAGFTSTFISYAKRETNLCPS